MRNKQQSTEFTNDQQKTNTYFHETKVETYFRPLTHTTITHLLLPQNWFFQHIHIHLCYCFSVAPFIKARKHIIALMQSLSPVKKKEREREKNNAIFYGISFSQYVACVMMLVLLTHTPHKYNTCTKSFYFTFFIFLYL